jgi:lysophospholipase L1-like esterase
MYSYLALGDSYTIGEQVPMHDNFPHQTVKLLRGQGVEIADPIIIAVTGWTTDELANSIREHNLHDTFNMVTLLIGVNNQYRGRSTDDYRQEFTQLINTAITYANGLVNRVFVLSIPDWGVTPFAEGRDREQIGREIEAYNAANKDITAAFKCHYVAITDSTREHGHKKDFLAGDGLHPSAKEYSVWAERLGKAVGQELKST